VLTLSAAVRILLWSEPVDMRKGINGLSMLVRSAGEDMFSGHLFVFAARRRQQVRILTWQRGGFVLLTKRMDRGRFTLPELPVSDGRMDLDAALLSMLLDGVNLAEVKRSDAWQPPSRRVAG
jgi:transposase